MAGVPTSEQVQQNLKFIDQGAEKTAQKTPEAVKDGGVEGSAGKRRVLDEKDIVNPIDRNASTEEKIA